MGEKILTRIKEIRKDLKLTQEEFAAKLNVSRQTIISIEKGKYTPSLPLALKIAIVVNMPVEEIFTLADERA